MKEIDTKKTHHLTVTENMKGIVCKMDMLGAVVYNKHVNLTSFQTPDNSISFSLHSIGLQMLLESSLGFSALFFFLCCCIFPALDFIFMHFLAVTSLSMWEDSLWIIRKYLLRCGIRVGKKRDKKQQHPLRLFQYPAEGNGTKIASCVNTQKIACARLFNAVLVFLKF